MTESSALPAFDVPFDPVPVAARHDGRTPDKQCGFIDALAACGCVKAAADHRGFEARRDQVACAWFARNFARHTVTFMTFANIADAAWHHPPAWHSVADQGDSR